MKQTIATKTIKDIEFRRDFSVKWEDEDVLTPDLAIQLVADNLAGLERECNEEEAALEEIKIQRAAFKYLLHLIIHMRHHDYLITMRTADDFLNAFLMGLEVSKGKDPYDKSEYPDRAFDILLREIHQIG